MKEWKKIGGDRTLSKPSSSRPSTLKNSVHTVPFYDKMSVKDLREMYKEKMREEILNSYTFPEKPSTDGYYHIYVRDSLTGKRKAVKSKSLDGLKEKVYGFESGMGGQTKKTFRDCFELVQSEKLRYIKNPEKRLSVENTISRNRSEYRRFFAGKAIEGYFVDEVTKRDIGQVVEENLQKYDLHPKGLASMRAILKSVFDLAYQESWIGDNVYSRIDFRKYSDMLSEPVPTEERYFTDKELERMMHGIRLSQSSKPAYLTPYALELQLICGLRRGEVPPLRWADVYENHIAIWREQLTIKKTGSSAEHFEIVSHSKNYKRRKYPMTTQLAEFLERLRAVHDRYYPESEFLFPADNENGCITNNCVYNYFRRICKKENIKISREVIKGTHAFRRTRISEVVNKSNGNFVLASEMFGNSPEVARKHYYTGYDMEYAKNILETR